MSASFRMPLGIITDKSLSSLVIILVILSSMLVTTVVAQSPYSCKGYGGMFGGNLGLSKLDSVLVANLPNSYGNTDIRIGFIRPVLTKTAECILPKRPCVVLVHGGGWVSAGSQDAWLSTLTGLAPFFATEGFVVASIKYRLGIGGGNEIAFLSNNGCLINPVSDVTTAVGRGAYDTQLSVQYIISHADSLGIDTNNIFLIGFSAGAYNVMHARI